MQKPLDIDQLNSEQQKAATHFEGPLLILAGAGTGKTKTITYRVAYLIRVKNIVANSILAVTFTNKATQEMRERLAQIIPPNLIKGLTVSTFHSLGVSILKESIHLLGYHPQFTIYDTSDQLSLVSEALRCYHSDKSYDRKIILAKIGWLKNQGLSPFDWITTSHFHSDDLYDVATEYVYHYYQEKLRFYNAIDFDDILFLTVKLLEEHSDEAQRVSNRFQFILVDEYQDTNPLQFRLLKQLTSTHKNICVVGDDDQSIYGFRGADISNILDFEIHFPNTFTIKLEENYRCTQPILDLANQVIQENCHRKGKTLWSQKKEGEKPLLWICDSSESEASLVIGKVHDLIKQGVSPSQLAIIYRSNNQALPFEELLRLEGINYKMIGGQKFYEKKEVKDLIAYLSLLQNPYDEISLRRILNVPQRGIGPQTLNLYLQRREEVGTNLLEVLFSNTELAGIRQGAIEEFKATLTELRKIFRMNPLPEAILQMINRLHFIEHIEKTYKESKQVEKRKNDLYQMVEMARRFLSYLPPGVPPLKAFIEKLLLADQENQNETDEDKQEESIWMMTLHSAKGLEFDYVFLVGMEEEILPHKKSITDAPNVEEERRLCYVGMTRAKKELQMTFCQNRTSYGQEKPREKSRFLSLSALSYYQEESAQKFLCNEERSQDYLKKLIENLEQKVQ